MNFEITFSAFKPENFAFYLMQIAGFKRNLLSSRVFVIVILLNEKNNLDTVFGILCALNSFPFTYVFTL